MKLVKQSFEILEQEIPVRKLDDYSGSHFREQYIDNMYKHIEKCGRTCYKSEHRITEGSAKKFVDGLIKSKHLSVLEHGVIYLMAPAFRGISSTGQIMHDYLYKGTYGKNPYSNTFIMYGKYITNEEQREFTGEETIDVPYDCVTTNYRVIIENGWEEDLQYLCFPVDRHEKRHTVLLHSCIHVYKDLTRHRKMSFSIESTRYVNLSRTDKYGEMKFILPPWTNLEEGTYNGYKIGVESDEDWYLLILKRIELEYNTLIEHGWQAQQAAEILPQATAADVVISGFSSDWEFIFRLRTSYIHETGQPHPLVSELMDPLYLEFLKRCWIELPKWIEGDTIEEKIDKHIAYLKAGVLISKS